MKFIKADLCSFLNVISNLKENQKPIWGKMSAQRMIEHLTDSIRMSCGLENNELDVPEEKIERMQAFLASEKPMAQNIQVSFASENTPLRNLDIELAIDEFTNTWVDFEEMYSEDKNKTARHPHYGDLNFEKWMVLHSKHFTHHFSQFGLIQS